MNREPQLALGTDTQRYGALFRISEALSACGEPEELTRVLADQLRELISFDHLDALIFKEDSNEIEWQGWGTEPIAFPDLPVEETSTWHVFCTQERLHIADWNTDDTYPRAKRLLQNAGVKLGSVIRVPLTTAHRRIDGDHAVEVFETVGVDCAHSENASIADEDVERAEDFCCFGHGGAELFGGSAVGFHSQRFASPGFDFVYKFQGFFFRTREGKCD
jgi:GAF domain